MKRLLALLLAAVMCMSLVACGEDDEPSPGEVLYDKYEDIIDLLEDDKFEEAYEELKDLAGGTPSQGDVLYTKYKELIDLLENKQFGTAHDRLESMAGQPNSEGDALYAKYKELLTLLEKSEYDSAHDQLESIAGGPISQGDKLYEKYAELLGYLEEAKYAEAYQLLLNLAGGSIPGDNTQAYGEIIDYLDREMYTSAIQAVIDLANERAPKPEPNDMRALLLDNWYSYNYSTEKAPEEITAEFYEDGTCMVNGEKLTWLATSTGDDYMHMDLYNNGVKTHNASIIVTECNVLRVAISSVDSNADNYISKSFYSHPLLPHLFRDWSMVDTTNDFDTGIGINTSYVSMQIGDKNKQFKYTVASYDDPTQLTLNIYLTDPEQIEYTATIYSKDGRYVADLTDIANHATYLYCNNYTGGYSKSWPEYLYRWAMNRINYAVKNDYWGYVNDPETDEHLNNDNAIRAVVYRCLDKCGDYKDSKTLLANFTVHKKMISKVNRTWVENLGSTHTNYRCTYSYNSDGTLFYSDDSGPYRIYFGRYNSWDASYFEYDANGRVTRITAGTGDDIRAIYTPEYDANGNMISLKGVTNSTPGGWICAKYTYDANGRMTLAEYYSASKPEERSHHVTFTYDDQGRLIQQTFYDDAYTYGDYIPRDTLDYTYDAAGNLATETYTDYTYDYKRNDATNQYEYVETAYQTVVNTYTCDAEGDIVSAVVTDSYYTEYSSITDEYIYEDLYFYTFPETN